MFKYKSICHTSFGVNMYSTNVLVVGEVYDVYLAIYHYTSEYEIFKDDKYYTSFILETLDYEDDENFLKYFYNESQMIQKIRGDALSLIGL